MIKFVKARWIHLLIAFFGLWGLVHWTLRPGTAEPQEAQSPVTVSVDQARHNAAEVASVTPSSAPVAPKEVAPTRQEGEWRSASDRFRRSRNYLQTLQEALAEPTEANLSYALLAENHMCKQLDFLDEARHSAMSAGQRQSLLELQERCAGLRDATVREQTRLLSSLGRSVHDARWGLKPIASNLLSPRPLSAADLAWVVQWAEPALRDRILVQAFSREAELLLPEGASGRTQQFFGMLASYAMQLEVCAQLGCDEAGISLAQCLRYAKSCGTDSAEAQLAPMLAELEMAAQWPEIRRRVAARALIWLPRRQGPA